MLSTTMQRLTGLVLLAAATLSVRADAGDDEVRIGRYATVVDRSPRTEKDTTSRPGSMVLPSEISSRTDAVQWILEQHGYRLYENTCDAFDLASGLAAPLSIHSPKQLPRSLRLALKAVLGPGVEVLVDSGTRQVVLSRSNTHVDSQDDAGHDA